MILNPDSPALTPLEMVHQSLEGDDPDRLARALNQLMRSEPNRWHRLLLIGGVIPDPDTKDLRARLSRLLRGVQSLLELEGLNQPIEDLTRTFWALLMIQARLEAIKTELGKLQFTNATQTTKLYRLTAFLEDQARLIDEKAHAADAVVRVHDPTCSVVSTVSNRFDDSRVSLVQVFEGSCELIELIIRYVLHTGRGKSPGVLDVSADPYHDSDFQKLLGLGALWKQLLDLWGLIKYSGWLFVGENDGYDCFVPPERVEFLRKGESEIREQLFLAEAYLPELLRCDTFSNGPDRIEHLARSIVVPQPGECWDGNLNVALLRDTLSWTHFDRLDDLMLQGRHYQPVLDRIVVDASVPEVTWQVWLRVYRATQVIAQALTCAIAQQVHPESADACLRQAIAVYRQRLADLVSQACGFDRTLCAAAVNLLVFDPRRKQLEIWDQPLIPLDAERFLMPLRVILSAHPAQAAEHFLEMDGGTAFSKRGHPFEKYIADLFSEAPTAQAKPGVRVVTADGSELEFDVLVFWCGFLLLLETKCLKSVHSPADECRAHDEVEEAIRQLQRRRGKLAECWEQILAAAPELELPKAPPPADRVLCIAVTNLFRFSALQRDGIVVTDDLCLNRFFGSPDVRKLALGLGRRIDFGPVERIRPSDEPLPDELMAYLMDPPQMKRVRPGLRIAKHCIPGLGEHRPILIPRIEFRPDEATGATGTA